MRFCLITLSTLTLIVSAAAASDDWPQFRGPGGQGHCAATGLPLKWSETENVSWKTAIEGYAWSSPVVLGNQVWMTTALPTPATPEQAKRKLADIGMPVPSVEVAGSVTLKAVCVDRTTGRLLQAITLFDVDEPLQVCSVNSYASPTPVVEPGRLYCDFGTMGTACIDTATGKILWKRLLPIEHQVGPGSSPILYGDLLVLVRDGCDAQYVAALNKNSGETVWKTDRPPHDATGLPYKKAFSTPLVIETTVGRQMIVLAAQWVVSYEPDSGKPLWRVDTGKTFSNTTRPVFAHGLVFIGTAFGGAQLLAIRVDGRGDVTGTHVAWDTRKQVPKRCSPLVDGDELYTVADGGVASCLDARTGTVQWAERLSGNCSASPVLVEGRIYFFSEDGTATVVQPGKQFRSLAENKIDGRIMASVAIADGAFFLRTATHLYRIEKK